MTTAIGSSLTHDIGADGLLNLRLHDGDVRLRAVDGPTVRVDDRGGHDLDEMFSIDAAGGSLALRSARGSDLITVRQGRRPTPELDVEVPRGATIVVEAVSGDIGADGLLGDQRYRTASGDVVLRAVSGRIRVEAVSGDVDIVATGSSAVAARTVSGDIALRAANLPSLRITSTSGDLRIAGRLVGPGPFSIETVSGDALLAPAGDVRVEMTTVTGDMSSDLDGRSDGGRGRRTIVVGAGEPLVTFRSMSGDLRLVRPTSVGVSGTTAATTATRPTEAARSTEAAGSTAASPTPAMSPAIAAAYDEARLRILRSLERGEIDVTEAGRRLEALDGGDTNGPRTTATAVASDA